MTKKLLTIFVAFFPGLFLFGQDIEIQDSLRASVKTDTRRLVRVPFGLSTDVKSMSSVVSPLGEGDPIKWAQALPGITTGADGFSSFFVRGGNAGNNLISLDGVPVYGYSHLLGLTTAFPQTIIGKVTMSKGGYEGSESNFTSSHLEIDSKNPSVSGETSVAVNNFLISTSDERRISNRTSYLISARISPLGLEYGLLHGLLSETLGDLSNLSATVGDLYGKVHVDLGAGRMLDVSAIGTIDDYSFSMNGEANDRIGWSNASAQIRYRASGNLHSDYSLYVNHFSNFQKQDKIYRGEWNHLSLSSELTELSASAEWTRKIIERLTASWGTRLRGSIFQPGKVASVSNTSWTILHNAYFQADYNIPGRLESKAYLRTNSFVNIGGSAQFGNKCFTFCPEGGAAAILHVGDKVSIETSADRLVQFYHTIEGMPIGWNLDMIVPSGANISPESVLQMDFCVDMDFGCHSISIGGFHKWMDNLVYYKYSQSLFNGGMADWAENIDQGHGQSYGGEFLYEFKYRNWYTRMTYTLSRTDRSGFESICNGEVFNARFDRRHVMNALIQWKGISAAFTLQSGHWENGASQKYVMTIPGDELIADYYSGVNNYHMPTVLRLDLGYEFSFISGPVTHEVNVGIFNVTNHFNPLMLIYESDTETWKQLSLLPIMPNFSWKLKF